MDKTKHGKIPAVGRRFPVGVELLDGGGHFRVWAPACAKVAVVLENIGDIPVEFALHAEEKGYFSGLIAAATAGSCYRYRLGGNENLHTDPVSRFQPMGPHGYCEIIDPSAFVWTDSGWQGIEEHRHVIYELHIGTFTEDGSWAAAMSHLPTLRDLGVTTLQVMPIADFPGRFGWGYDGVNLFAPSRLYGRPDDFRSFVNQAHVLGLAVILDVVYNHLGPDGSNLHEFSDDYLSSAYQTDWGRAMNFDGTESGPVREFFLSNARYWMEEFHLDGLRLDATQNIYDSSEKHIIEEIVETVRQATQGRSFLVISENEPQDSTYLLPVTEGGFGVTATLNDDFHHSAMVALTGCRKAYFSDHRGTPQEFISLAKYGYLFQGQYYHWQKQKRGKPALTIPPYRFVNCIENHDQVANLGHGFRIHQLTSPGRFRALTAILLLFPQIPMLFQGQEFASSARFLYFADHVKKLSAKVRQGRIEFLSQFKNLATEEMCACQPDPACPETFFRSKIDHAEREKNGSALRLHADLLALRRHDPVFGAVSCKIDGAVLEGNAFVLRYFGYCGEERLLIVNLGQDLCLESMAEPLLAPPSGQEWSLVWSSENPSYGGNGMVPLQQGAWSLCGESAIVMAVYNGGNNA